MYSRNVLKISLFLGHCHRRSRQRGSRSLWKWVSIGFLYFYFYLIFGMKKCGYFYLYLILCFVAGSRSRNSRSPKCFYHRKTQASIQSSWKTKRWRYSRDPMKRKHVGGGQLISRYWITYTYFVVHPISIYNLSSSEISFYRHTKKPVVSGYTYV